MQFKVVDSLSDKQSDQLFHWADNVFPEEGRVFKWAKSEWHILAFDEYSNSMAHLGYAGFDVTLDSRKKIRVVGVGGVVVRPEYQGKNIPEKLFSLLHSSVQAKSLSQIFTLFCPERLKNYYKKHGYSKFDGTYTFLQNGETVCTDKFIFMHYGSDLVANTLHVNGEPW